MRAAIRVALYLDVENLVHDLVEDQRWGDVEALLRAIVERSKQEGELAVAVACCNPPLARRVAFLLNGLGVRTFAHDGEGPDCADYVLIDEMAQCPSSVRTVVIGSGDHIFAPAVARFRGQGVRAIVFTRARTISSELVGAAEECFLIEPARSGASAAPWVRRHPRLHPEPSLGSADW